MMVTATREKKLEFIRSFGRGAIESAIMAAVCRHGAEHFLTDDQLDDIVSDQVVNARRMSRQHVRNRLIQKSRAA